MLNPLLSGIGIAVLLTIIPGPVFFGLIQASIQKGVKHGWMFTLGVALSDLVCIVLTYGGISSFLENQSFQNTVAVSGGFLMCIVGLFYFFKPPEKSIPLNPMQKEMKKRGFLFKGFLMNILNPGTLFYWVALVSVVSVKYSNNDFLIFTFFIALLLTIVIIDFLKSYIASRIKAIFTFKLMSKLNKGLGVILFLVGVKLLFDVYIGVSFLTP